MKYIVSLNGKKYEVEVAKGQATATYVGKATPPVPDEGPAQPAAQQPMPQTASLPGGGDAIKAPMPGTILKVNVQSGQQVKAGDILFILEAMKMENEIVAPHDGQITAVATTTGATVETDTVLATLQ